MQNKDYSKEIYDKYYSSNGKTLKIVLKDDSVLNGIFVGFSNGDIELGEPHIISWHFVPETEIKKYRTEILAVETMQEYGRIIKQEDIKSITFK